LKGLAFADLNDIVLLMHVVDKGGYSAAARALNLPKSTISQRIAALEAAIGTGLLRRTSRSFSLTEAGKALLPYAKAINEQATEAQQRILGLENSISGTLSVSTSVALAQFAIAPLIPAFLRKHPKVSIRIDVTNRYVDLIGEGYDMGIRAHGGGMKDSALRQRVVARTEWSLAASPGWVANNRAILKPQDLAGKEILYFVTHGEDPCWTLSKAAAQYTLTLTPRFVSDDMGTLMRAAIEGAGITALPTYILAAELNAGRLVPVLPGWCTLISSISILTPSKRQSSRLSGVFSDYIDEELGPIIGTNRR